jgi:hypothetical protein
MMPHARFWCRQSRNEPAQKSDSAIKIKKNDIIIGYRSVHYFLCILCIEGEGQREKGYIG